VLLIHGFPTSTFLWRAIAPRLAELGHTAISIDLLGYGESDRPLDGDYSIAAQVWTQAKAVGVTLVWSAVVAAIAYSIANVLVGLRVPEEEEREGLDITSHGETAYTA